MKKAKSSRFNLAWVCFQSKVLVLLSVQRASFTFSKKAQFCFQSKGLGLVSVKGLVLLSVKRAKRSSVKFEKVTKKKNNFSGKFFFNVTFL